MSVYKIRFGEPEAFVPSAFAPEALCEVLEGKPGENGIPPIASSISNRGCKLTMSIDGTAGVYGFGLQLKAFQQRGMKKHIRPNADPVSNSGDTHAPVPFFVTTAGFGIYVDTARYAEFYMSKRLNTAAQPVRKTDIPGKDTEGTDIFGALYAIRSEKTGNVMTIEVPYAPGVDIYYITGDTVLDIVSQYNLLSGGGCMPPLWGLGNLYRCDMKFGEEQVLAMAEKFRAYDIPCDIIGLEPGWQNQTYSCSYVWDSGRFPHPQETVGRLQDMGFHVNLWEHAFVHPSSPIHEALKPYSGDYLVWNGLVPDFTLKEARNVFADHQKTLVDMGVTGFKLDECDGSDFTGGWTFPNCASFPSGMDGDQYHSMFGMLYAQVIGQALGEQRTLSEVRQMGSLAASYPFVLYSDLYGHRDFITGVVNAGFSGLLWSPEVRHAESREDLLRRIQSVVFSVQSLVNAFYLPTMPWEQHDCIEEARELFRVRMMLLPYLYTMFYDYHTQGKPPVRALVCDYQNEPEALDRSDEYLFGDSMIAAPMIAPEKERDVWLPKGTWYDFFTGERFEGGMHHVVTDRIPVYVKAGTLLPLAEPVSFVAPDTKFRITLRAYGDCSGSVCRLIEDRSMTKNDTYRVIRVTERDTEIDSFRYEIAAHEQIDG